MRYIIGDKQKKDGERQQHGDSESHFLSGVWRQKEHECLQERHQHARPDDVHNVVHRLASQMQTKRHRGIVLVRRVVVNKRMPKDFGRRQFPFAVGTILGHVDPFAVVVKLHRGVRVRPAAEDEVARLGVEWVNPHVELTRRIVDAARGPDRVAIVVHLHKALLVRLLVENLLSAAKMKTGSSSNNNTSLSQTRGQ